MPSSQRARPGAAAVAFRRKSRQAAEQVGLAGRGVAGFKLVEMSAHRRLLCRPPSARCSGSAGQARLFSTKFWPPDEVQLSWLVEISRQLKLIGCWRISDVPVICTDVAVLRK